MKKTAYINRETGELLMTWKEMYRQFAELYDGGDDTNPIGWEEYYATVPLTPCDYKEAAYRDIIEYIVDNISYEDFENLDEQVDALREALGVWRGIAIRVRQRRRSERAPEDPANRRGDDRTPTEPTAA